MSKEDFENSNIEWGQKKGVDDQTRASRRLDIKKVQEAENKSRNNFKTKRSSLRKTPPSLKKIKNKIKDVYDDEEDDEENEGVIFTLMPDQTNSSLLDALREDEKKKFLSKQTLENQKMQDNAGKMEAIALADKTSKQMGLKGLKKKISYDNLQDVSLSSQTFEKALKQNIEAKTNIRTKNLTALETTYLAKGLRKMQQAAQTSAALKKKPTESMKSDDLIEIGKSRDDKETAEMILEKSGRREAKSAMKKAENRKKIKQALHQKSKNVREL